LFSLFQKLEADELAFITDNLAHFSYQILDEPLYIINQSEAIISLAGQNILGSFKRPVPYGQPEEDDDYLIETIYSEFRCYDHSYQISHCILLSIERLPTEKSQLQELRKNSHACSLLLQLKSYLMRAYRIKDEYVPARSS